MDKRLKRTFLAWHAQGLSATDVMIRHNKDPRREYDVHTVEVADVLKQMGAKDPHRRIEQKPEIQPDMPKRFIPLQDSVKKRQKMTYRQPSVEQRQWHEIVCGISQNGRKLLKSGSRHLLERRIVEYLEKGYEQVGNISTDFYCDGELYMALVQKKEDTDDAR